MLDRLLDDVLKRVGMLCVHGRPVDGPCPHCMGAPHCMGVASDGNNQP